MDLLLEQPKTEPAADEAKGPATTKRRAVLVLGMHRSGTSALTRVLNLLGCALPENLIGAGRSNETGHWEPRVIREIDGRILRAAGSRWDDWLPFDPSRLSESTLSGFREEAAEAVRQEYDDAALMVLKDPRLCRMVPFWTDVLDTLHIEPAFVLCLRHPQEVAASLEQRNGLDRAVSEMIWLRHVLEAEHATRGRPRYFSSYDRLLRDWRRIAEESRATLGIAWPRPVEQAAAEIDAFLSEAHRHHREHSVEGSDDPARAQWLRDAYGILEHWAEMGEAARDYAALDQVREAFNPAAARFSASVTEEAEHALPFERPTRQASA